MEPVAYSIGTPDGDSGPYFSDVDVRRVVQEYRDLHGDDAVVRDVTVHRMAEQTGTGQAVDVREFLSSP